MAARASSGDDAPWVAPQADQAKVNPVSPSKDAVKRGRALFLKHCATCHGPGGKGDGPAAAFGMVTPRDLTSPTVQARLTDGEIFWKLSKGRKVGSDVVMPAGRREDVERGGSLEGGPLRPLAAAYPEPLAQSSLKALMRSSAFAPSSLSTAASPLRRA